VSSEQRLWPYVCTNTYRWLLPGTGVRQQRGWNVTWTDRDDVLLLCGVLKHGYGAWHDIKMDPALSLADKVCSQLIRHASTRSHADRTARQATKAAVETFTSTTRVFIKIHCQMPTVQC
jgi:hypothetical protein